MIEEASAPASRLSRLLSMAHADVWIVFLCVSLEMLKEIEPQLARVRAQLLIL